MFRREVIAKGSLILNLDRSIIEMQFNTANVNMKWGMWRKDPSIQRVMGSLARTRIDFFSPRTKLVQKLIFFFLCTGIGWLLNKSIILWTYTFGTGVHIFCFKYGVAWLYGALPCGMREGHSKGRFSQIIAEWGAHCPVERNFQVALRGLWHSLENKKYCPTKLRRCKVRFA